LRIADACREVDVVEMKRKALWGTGAKIHRILQGGPDLKNENRAAEQGLPAMEGDLGGGILGRFLRCDPQKTRLYGRNDNWAEGWGKRTARNGCAAKRNAPLWRCVGEPKMPG